MELPRQSPTSGEPSGAMPSRAEKHVREGVEFAKSLLKKFSSGDNEIPAIQSLIQEIRSHIDKLHVCQERYMPAISGDAEIDELGTNLWNVSTRLKRDRSFSVAVAANTTAASTSAAVGVELEIDDDGDVSMIGVVPCTGANNIVDGTGSVTRLVVYGRVLALYLLAMTKKPSPKDHFKTARACRELIRLMKLVLKAGKDCIELVSPTPTAIDAHGATTVNPAGNTADPKGKGVATKSHEEREQDTRLATMVMEIAAGCKADLQDFHYTSSKCARYSKAKGHGKVILEEEEVKECNCLEVEYFVLRTALAWVDKRIDVAEHMYTKSEGLHKFLTPSYAERMTDVLYQIGKSFLSDRDYPMAIKWLERASVILNTQPLGNLSREGDELRLALFQALVAAYLGSDTPERFEHAKNLVDFVESQLGSTQMIVSLLRLEVLSKSPLETLDHEAYSDVLRRMIQNSDLTDATLKLLTHHIQKLHNKQRLVACSVMDELIHRVQENDDLASDWMEKLVIQRIWMVGFTAALGMQGVDAVVNMLGLLKQPFSPMACMATHGLLWMKMSQIFDEGHYELAEKWGQMMLLPMFDQLGNRDRCKAERKLILCALARNDLPPARSTIDKISEQNMQEPMTAYLGFKVAIRVNDRDLAERCLEVIGQSKDHIEYLAACIAESQKAEDIQSAVSGLKRLHLKYAQKASPGKIHLPALFRSSIRLLHVLLASPMYPERKVEFVNQLCQEFGSAASAVKQHDYTFDETVEEGSRSNLFTVEELEWFSVNAYNLGVKNTSNWDMRSVIWILNSCVQIIGYFPTDYSREHMVDLSLKVLFSRFLIASALASLARAQDHIAAQRSDYIDMRRHVGEFDKTLVELLTESQRRSAMMAVMQNKTPGVGAGSLGQQQQGTGHEKSCLLDAHSRLDLSRKLATLLTFDFEAAIALGKWDDLGQIVAKVKAIDRQGEKKSNLVIPFQAMADCLLRAATTAVGGASDNYHIGGQVVYSTMRILVNEIWLLESFDAVKLAKYTRCLFQATLPLDDGLALNLLDEACGKARELRERNTNSNYWPDDELEWMATTAFNHSIDCYAAREMDKARRWATKSMELAHYCRDVAEAANNGGGGSGGQGSTSLERSMQAKFVTMRFDRGNHGPAH